MHISEVRTNLAVYSKWVSTITPASRPQSKNGADYPHWTWPAFVESSRVCNFPELDSGTASR